MRTTAQVAMAPQQARVLRCYACLLFQVHQVKKNLKWNCKACGKKQSVLRAYGEGSAADCRCHVQKLNLLQGQVSEMSLSLSPRSLEEPVNADGEGNAGPEQAEHAGLQEKRQPSENRWLKYLERDTKEGEPKGAMCFNKQSSSETKRPGPSFNKDLPRKRKWSQSTAQPPCSPDIQESGNSEATRDVQQDQAVQAEIQNGSSCEDRGPRGQPPHPALQVRATSKWEPFLLSSENHSSVATEPPIPQRELRPAEQGTPRPQTLKEEYLRGSPSAIMPLQTHTSKRVCGKMPEQTQGTDHWAERRPLIRGRQECPLVRLCDLFKTDEDFDDDM